MESRSLSSPWRIAHQTRGVNKMISCRVAALTVLLSTASTLTLARTEELPKEEARSEEVDVEASEEAVSIESTASAEALAFVQATTMPEDDEWHFIVAPYLWLVDTSITRTSEVSAPGPT